MSGLDAFGTQFYRGNGATPTEAFTAMANVTSVTSPERTRDTIDVTAHDSPDGWREFVGSLKDGGEVSLEINYDPSNDTHDLDDDFDDKTPRSYRVVILPGDPDEHTWDFKAILTQLSEEFPHDDKMSRTMTVKVSGKPTLTPTGS